MSTELRTTADIRRELEERSRDLAAKTGRLDAIYSGQRDGEGKRIIHPHQVEEIQRLEKESEALIPTINSLKYDWAEANNRERSERLRQAGSTSAAIFSGGSTDGKEAWPTSSGGETVEVGTGALKTTVRLPENLGQAFVEGKAYKSWSPGAQGQMAGMEIPACHFRDYAAREAMKATLLTSTGPFTAIDKQPSLVSLGQQQMTVADLLASATTNAVTIRYIREDTFTNAAAMLAEEGQKPEMTWDLSEVDVTIKKIAVVSRTTTEMMEDHAQIMDYINQRLPFAVQQREELQLITGDGLGNNLQGILSLSGILTQAKGTLSNLDAIYTAMVKVRTQGFWEPDAIVMNPTNFTPIRLLKTTTGDYVYGPPSIPGPETIFGKRVVQTVNMTANTAVVGAWRLGGTLFYRRGIRIEATNSDASDFVYNRVAIRAEERVAPVWWRPSAFCSVTGLDAG
jgi:HK97 family phage major capsid protein